MPENDSECSGYWLRFIWYAPRRQMRPPARESGATVSLRRRTPRARATTGVKNVVLEARLAAQWPAAFAISTLAMAVRRIVTAWARQMTGTAPYFCCRPRTIAMMTARESQAATSRTIVLEVPFGLAKSIDRSTKRCWNRSRPQWSSNGILTRRIPT